MRALLLLFLLIGIGCQDNKPAEIMTDQDRLIGTWDLVEWTGIKEDGSIIYPFGETCIGMLIYTPEGTVALSLSKDSRPALGSDDYSGMSRDTLLEAYSGFFSYHGTYSIDEQAHRINHQVEACKIPDWKGREQIRLYSFRSDSLILKAEKVIGLQHELLWVRRR